MGYTSRVKLGLVLATASLAVLTASPVAGAEPAVGDRDARSASAARVRVDAPDDCATTATFWRALSERTDRLRVSDGNENAATIDVVIKRQGARVRGELRLARAGERPSTRSLGGASCAEVTDGLSLVAALAFDPGAKMERARAAEEAEGENEREGVEEKARASEERAVAAEPAADRPLARTTRSEGLPTFARWGATAFGGGLGTGAPDLSFVAGGSFDLEIDRSQMLSPLFRLGAMYGEGSTEGALGAPLSWTFARAAVCPLRLALGGGVALRPCAILDAGVMSAEAPNVKNARGTARPWLAPGLEALVRWTLARPLFVEGRLGAGVPLVRDELAVDPTLTLYRAPMVVPWAHAGVGVSFP